MESWKVIGIAGIIGIFHSKLPAFHILYLRKHGEILISIKNKGLLQKM